LRRNCLLKHVIEGKVEGRIEITGRWGRRHNQLLDDFKEKTRYWKLKEEALDPLCGELVWKGLRTCPMRGYRMNVLITCTNISNLFYSETSLTFPVSFYFEIFINTETGHIQRGYFNFAHHFLSNTRIVTYIRPLPFPFIRFRINYSVITVKVKAMYSEILKI
jgi:hypothetical protein